MSRIIGKFVLMVSVTLVLVFTLSACIKGSSSDVSVNIEQGSTLKLVKSRGELIGGVTTSVPGYSTLATDDKWLGFDVDLLRAVAAAVLGDADKVSYKALGSRERFAALQSGEIDVLSRVSTWTIIRDTTLGLDWAGINFYDGQGIMVLKSSGINKINELSGASIGVQMSTTTEANLEDYLKARNIKYKMIKFDTNEEVAVALEAGKIDAFTSDASQLYAFRSKMKDPDKYMVLSTIISTEPLGPVVREGDSNWNDIVRWTFNAMVAAERFGITSVNVDSVIQFTANAEIKRLLGEEDDLGKGMGLDKKWAYRIIKQVGNYGEVFDKNLGSASPLNMERGLNNLWINNGLQYALPFR